MSPAKLEPGEKPGDIILHQISKEHFVLTGRIVHNNPFREHVAKITEEGLVCVDLDTIQVNLGLRCNQQCLHCHVDGSPLRTDRMAWTLLERVLEAAVDSGCRLVDLTGGAPELHPQFRPFVEALRKAGLTVQVRTNLTVFSEPTMESIPEFLKELDVHLVASLPCYLEENVNRQRGNGVYRKSIDAIRRLNTLGYGLTGELPLKLVYNPGGPQLPPSQIGLDTDYRRELGEQYGIAFTQLLTITNMPIGRFLRDLQSTDQEHTYRKLLRDNFNPATLEGLMCRHQISVRWDGKLFDCDFNLALGIPVNGGVPDHITLFDPAALAGRSIVTGEHCFGCTAGSGSSCGGALLDPLPAVAAASA